MLDFDDASLEHGPTVGNAPGVSDGAEFVEAAITSRRACRAFKPDPVPRDLVEHLLAVASRAPSGTNMQPWQVYVTAGDTKDRLTKAVLDFRHDPSAEFKRPWKYYPDEFPPVFKARRRKVGWDLYGLAGVEKGDREAGERFRDRNYVFFDAPIGMICTIDARLQIGSWLDYGCFLQNLMVAARAHGLETCAQAAFADMHTAIRQVLPIPDGETVVCGLALGYPDLDAALNQLKTEREPVSGFTQFFDL